MFSKLRENALAILIAALAVAGLYIAWDSYQDKTNKITQLQDQKKVDDEKIKDLVKQADADNKFKEESQKIDSGVVADVAQAKAQTTEAKKYVDKRLTEIEKKYQNMPKDEETNRAKTIEISLERARGLWAVYCIQLPKDPTCK